MSAKKVSKVWRAVMNNKSVSVMLAILACIVLSLGGLGDVCAQGVSVAADVGVLSAVKGDADVNGDGRVDIVDLALVAAHLGTRGNSSADLNGNSVVDIGDVALVAAGFNGAASAPAAQVSAPAGMVLIPGGTFQMGSNDAEAAGEEQPVHLVHVDAFYMDTHEVTNAEYKSFVLANPEWQKGRISAAFHSGKYLKHWNGNNYPAGKGDHPVTYVSWYAAMAYSAWAGKRLPTEAEWEYAARGGEAGLKYPWGNTISPANANYDRNVNDTTAVGSYAANGYGLFDMAGNVSEWCLDEYNAAFYAASPSNNPLSGVSGSLLANLDEIVSDYTGVNVKSLRVLRGGNWRADVRHLRVADRFKSVLTFTKKHTGFRCVSAVPAEPPTPEPEPPTPEPEPPTPEPEPPTTEPEPPTPQAPARMALIPAGTFQMGSNDAKADGDERPVHTVYVDAFYMDTHEVTNAEYKSFLLANPEWQKTHIPDAFHDGNYLNHWDGNNYPVGKGDHPVGYVSWYAAMAYSFWAGKRLPTEAEWEYAARGGLVGKKYPWGDTITPNDANYGRNVGDTRPVGSYAANGYGLYDMAGNVYEWCLDLYDRNFYSRLPSSNPLNGVSGSTLTNLDELANLDEIVDINVNSERVLRGGSWSFDSLFLRAANRRGDTPTDTNNRRGDTPTDTNGSYGFRCAWAVTPSVPPALVGMALIPAGTFQMGSNDAEAGGDEQPVHTVYVYPFYMDTHEVTNAEYKSFVLANPEWQKTRIPDAFHNGFYLFHWEGNNYPMGKGDHPVVHVSWYAAMAYSAWVGKRLPTEAEWEYAARGGLVGKKYPWGDTITPNDANYGNNVEDTRPVGSYAANGYGLYDMAGNVWEWCLDAYNGAFYSASPSNNPLSGVSGSTLANLDEIVDNYENVPVTPRRVLRGGSWSFDSRSLRAAFRHRDSPLGPGVTFGFRCVR